MEQQFESHPKRAQHEVLAKKVKDCEDESRELNRRIIEMEKSGKTSEGYLLRKSAFCFVLLPESTY